MKNVACCKLLLFRDLNLGDFKQIIEKTQNSTLMQAILTAILTAEFWRWVCRSHNKQIS